jgi:hypothetical protein
MIVALARKLLIALLAVLQNLGGRRVIWPDRMSNFARHCHTLEKKERRSRAWGTFGLCAAHAHRDTAKLRTTLAPCVIANEFRYAPVNEVVGIREHDVTGAPI